MADKPERRDHCVLCGYRRSFPFGTLEKHPDANGKREKVCAECLPRFMHRRAYALARMHA